MSGDYEFFEELAVELEKLYPNPFDLNAAVARLTLLAEKEYDTSDAAYAQGLSDGEDYVEAARDEAREEGYNAAMDDVEGAIENVRRSR